MGMPDEECTVTTELMSAHPDYEQYRIGCEHNTLAVVTINTRRQLVQLSLLLEHKTVFWWASRGSVHIVDSAEVG